MSDLGSHDNDVPYTVLELKRPDGRGCLAPLTVEAVSPNVPSPQGTCAGDTHATYEFAAVGDASTETCLASGR